MSDQLPSREAAGQAVAFAYRNLKGSRAEVADLVALGIHWSTGRLFDREAIDYEAARMMLEPSDSADRSYWLRKAQLIVDVAIGDTG